MKLSKLIAERVTGVPDVTVHESTVNPVAGGRFICSYNPTGRLKTADTAITRVLDETYKMKENMTEESVMDYFNEMLRDFDDDDTRSIRNDPKFIHQPSTMKLTPKKEENEFYFQKTNEQRISPKHPSTKTVSEQPKFHAIIYSPSQTRRNNPPKNSTNSTSFTIAQDKNSEKFNGTLEVTVIKSPRIIEAIQNNREEIEDSERKASQTIVQIRSGNIIHENSKTAKEIKSTTTLADSEAVTYKSKNNPSRTKYVFNVEKTAMSRNNHNNSIKSPGESGQQASIRSAASNRTCESYSSNEIYKSKNKKGKDSVRSFEISVHSSGSYKTNKTVNNSSVTKVPPLVRGMRKTGAADSKRHFSEKKFQREYKVEIYKSEAVPENIAKK